MAERSVEVGTQVVEGLKGYRDWANRAADKFLEKVVPGYDYLPEK